MTTRREILRAILGATLVAPAIKALPAIATETVAAYGRTKTLGNLFWISGAMGIPWGIGDIISIQIAGAEKLLRVEGYVSTSETGMDKWSAREINLTMGGAA